MRHPPMSAIKFITGSAHKFAEISAVLGPGVIEQLDIDLPEIQGIDPKEIIAAKLAEARRLHPDSQLFVEDTSLFLECLPGLPGPLIKWFMVSQKAAGLWRIAEALGAYGAEARATIGLATVHGDVHYFTGSVFGRVVAPRGTSNFGWDPIFLPDGYDRTFAEMTKEEKNAISHRGRAAAELKRFISQAGLA